MSKTSLHDADIRLKIETIPGVTFHGILFALISRADTDNLARLERAFPEVVREFKVRYYAPAGTLNIEEWLEQYGDDKTTPTDKEMLEALFEKARRIADG